MQIPTKNNNPVYLAVDLGAGSGRIMASWIDDAEGVMRLKEVHRFRSPPVKRDGHLRWDLGEILSGIFEGLRLAAVDFGSAIRSVAVDTWGLDFGLLDAHGQIMGEPLCYRDERHAAGKQFALERVGRDRLFSISGVHPLPFNTIFQLIAEKGAPDSRLEGATRLLFMPDLVHWKLCGATANERTIASTGGLLDAQSGDWAYELLEELDLPKQLFGDLVDPGTVLGPITAEVVARTGLPAHTQVVAVGSHDTASAVAATPFGSDNELFLSSGTWSIIGFEHDKPILDTAFAEAGFTNERGVFDTFRLLHNVAGLWILEECRREWAAAGEDVGYDQLLREASAAPAGGGKIDATSAEWIAPGGMVGRLREVIAREGGPARIDRGGLVRTIFEGLAEAYRRQYENLRRFTGHELGAVRIVGGGSQNALLNQMTADAIGQSVFAGPVEGSSLGNVLLQIIANGRLNSIAEGRRLVERSFPTREFKPVQNHRRLS